MPRPSLSLLLTILLACGDDSDPDAAESTASPSDTTTDPSESSGAAADSTGDDSTGVAADPYACVDADFTVDLPLAGPGWDPEAGLVDPQAQYVVSTTQALPFPDQLEAFGALAGAAGMAAAMTPGFVAASFATEPNCGFARTITVWRDEASMYAFVTGDAHAAAMAASDEVLASGRTTHFTISAEQMPYEWDAALAEIAAVEPF